MRMKRKLLCAFALCFLSVSALADAPDETERLVVYTSHKEEVYQPIVEEFERRTGVWVQVVSGGTTELLERIAAEAETPVADVMFGGGVESLLAYEDYFMPCDAPRDAMLAECRFENHRFVAFSRLPLAIIYNPRLVSRPPVGFADLLDDVACLSSDYSFYMNVGSNYNCLKFLNFQGVTVNLSLSTDLLFKA